MLQFNKTKDVKKVEAAKPAVKVEVKATAKPSEAKKVLSDKQRIVLLERKVAALEKKAVTKVVAKKK